MDESIVGSIGKPGRSRAKLGLPAPIVRDERRPAVRDALVMAAGTGVVEVYVGWALEPVRVTTRSRDADADTWATAGVVLRERVARAIRPLLDAGWKIEGSAISAMRWDTSRAAVGRVYDGCWVRMRSRPA